MRLASKLLLRQSRAVARRFEFPSQARQGRHGPRRFYASHAVTRTPRRVVLRQASPAGVTIDVEWFGQGHPEPPVGACRREGVANLAALLEGVADQPPLEQHLHDLARLRVVIGYAYGAPYGYYKHYRKHRYDDDDD